MRFSPIVLLLFAMMGCGERPVSSQEKIIAAIEKMGGLVIFDEESPNKPVKAVDFCYTKVTGTAGDVSGRWLRETGTPYGRFFGS